MGFGARALVQVSFLIGVAIGVVVPVGALAEGTDACPDALVSRHQALWHHVTDLNRRLFDSSSRPDVVSLYLGLKREEERVRSARQVSPEAESALRSGPLARRYRIEDMDAFHLKQFYLNSLYALYVRAADLFVQEELRIIAGQTELLKSSHAKELLKFVTVVLQSFFRPFGLRDQDLTVQRAEEYFADRAWQRFPWREAFVLVEHWLSLGDQADLGAFDRLWAEASKESVMSREVYDRISRALCDRPPSGPLCCHSGMACIRCPHNRLFLRPDRGSGDCGPH